MSSVTSITPKEDLKLELFLAYYLDKDNKETYANATQSAIKSFSLDPEKQYKYARKIGTQMVAKSNINARTFMDDANANLAYMITFALHEMQTAKSSTDRRLWWKELMIVTGYSKQGEQINNFIQQNNTTNVSVQNNILAPEEAQKINANFLKFIESGGLNDRPEDAKVIER